MAFGADVYADCRVDILASVDELRAVLVTGASTGIGEATALRLAHGGWQAFAGFEGRPMVASQLR